MRKRQDSPGPALRPRRHRYLARGSIQARQEVPGQARGPAEIVAAVTFLLSIRYTHLGQEAVILRAADPTMNVSQRWVSTLISVIGAKSRG